ncbi:MAG: tetratricopeptide repeat protein [Bacteroidales bacterium]|nr:tetratricopeptide repeat protein [Bacteroidales bacterium]
MKTKFIPQMKMRAAGLSFTIISLTILCTSILKSQSQQIPDSIYQQLDTATGRNRVLTLQILTGLLNKSDTTMAYVYFDKATALALQLNLDFDYVNLHLTLISGLTHPHSIARLKNLISSYQKQSNKRGEGVALSYIGREFLFLNNYDSSEYYQDQALSFFTEINYDYGEAMALERKGQVYLIRNQYTDALKYYYQAFNINETNGFERPAAISLYHIGLTNLKMGNYEQAVDNILRSLRYWEKTNEIPNIWNCNELIGNIYISLDDLDKALYYHREALRYRKLNIKLSAQRGFPKSKSHELGLAYSFNNIAEVYLKQGLLDSAKYYALLGLKLKSQEGVANDDELANSELNLGNIYLAMGNTDSARILTNLAAEKYRSLQNWSSYSDAFYSLGKIDQSQKNFRSAEKNFLEGLRYSSDVKSRRKVQDGYELLSKLYVENSDFKKAYEYFEKYSVLKDSIFNKAKSDAIEEMQIRFEVEKQEQKIVAQQALIEQKKLEARWSIIGGGILLLLLTIILILLLLNKRHREKLLTKEAETLRHDLELKNRELVCNVSNIYTKNMVINKVAKTLSRSTGNFKQSNMELVRDIISELKQNLDETGWKEFEYRFARVHESFYNTLDEKFPELTPTERKICAMLKLNMSSKEIAAITMVRSESVDTARSRIRKKLGIIKDENLTEFLNRL